VLSRQEEAELLLDKAEQMFLGMSSTDPLWRPYNMACIASIRQQEEPCQKWLNECLEV